MIKVGIIGCGMYSGAHARRMSARDDATIAALCDVSEANIENLVARRLSDYRPAPRSYTTAAAMYAAEGLDAVVIATPHHLHLPLASEALEHDCHVLIEKPMVTSLHEAQTLVALAASRKKHVGVCYNPVYTRACMLVREAIASGTYGRLEMVTGYLSQEWKRPTAGSWRHEPDKSGGGQAMDSGAHLFATLLWTTQLQPLEVFARVDTQGGAVDVNSAALISFADGTLASIAVGGNSPPDGSHLSFLFANGRIELDGWRGEWYKVFRPDGLIIEESNMGEASPDDNFVDALNGVAELRCTVADGLALAELMDAFYGSASTQAVAQVERTPRD